MYFNGINPLKMFVFGIAFVAVTLLVIAWQLESKANEQKTLIIVGTEKGLVDMTPEDAFKVTAYGSILQFADGRYALVVRKDDIAVWYHIFPIENGALA